MGENQQNVTNQVAGALAFPSRNEENLQPVPEQPQQPRDLQGLLRFALEATKGEDAPGNSEFGPMDESRRKFLEEALASLTVDMTEIVRKAIETLTNDEVIRGIQLDAEVPSDVREALDNLLELVDDMDVANDFYKLGGYKMFPICYQSENETIRATASTILGETCQNNPFCQSRALECGLLNVLLSFVQSEKGVPLVKSLYALSCACREYEPACKELVAQGGCQTLVELLHAEETAARTKAAFLIRYLCHNHAEAKEKFIELNLVKKIAMQIKEGRDSITEHLLSIVLALLENRDSTVIQQCLDPRLDLEGILKDHLNHPDLKDDSFMEEKDYCQEILTVLGSYPPVENVGDEVDR